MAPAGVAIRRFGQFFRQAGHFGKRTIRIETGPSIAGAFPNSGKLSFRRWKNSSRKPNGDVKMKTVTKEFSLPASLALMFAGLSVISTMATAVMPLMI
jgi:hypothetical protein